MFHDTNSDIIYNIRENMVQTILYSIESEQKAYIAVILTDIV